MHPSNPPGWFSPQLRCEGPLHVISEGYLDTKVNRVFAAWSALLTSVRNSPTAHLAEDLDPVFVYVFGSTYACKYYMRSQRGVRADGCYIPQTQQVYASSGDLGRPERFLQVVRHELTHHLHWSKTESRPPRWLSEGIAERFESDQGGYSPRGLTPDIAGTFAWTHQHLVNPVEQRARYGHARALVRAILDEPGAAQRFPLLLTQPEAAEDMDTLCEFLELDSSRLQLIYARELRRRVTPRRAQARRARAQPTAEPPQPIGYDGVWLTVGLLAFLCVPVAAVVVARWPRFRPHGALASRV